MWRKYRLTHAFWSGLAAGILLGLLLKMIEYFTSLKVYTLLLNIDYLPILQQLKLSEFTEFALHLVISVLLSGVLAVFLKHKEWSWSTILFFVTVVCVLVGLLIYPTTALSERTPDLFDSSAILLWLAGHLVYGIALGSFLGRIYRESSQSK